ncbi:MAG: hypothetical protein ACOCVF_00455 [bacterium]
MSTIFRTYFTKNNVISSINYNNFAKNPVAEISHYSQNGESILTRYIFDIDIENIKNRLDEMDLGENINVKHVLKLTNTVRYSGDVPQYSYSKNIERAKSSDLELVSVNEDWDEGNGYTFTFNKSTKLGDGSNWVNKRTNIEWLAQGYYIDQLSEQIGTYHFDTGNENFEMDVTDYVANRVSGNTISQGLMLKFTDEYENAVTDKIKSIAYHTKYTNTVYEPFVETIIDDEIQDDRTNFHRDKYQKLYLNLNLKPDDTFTVNRVKIIDYENKIYDSITTDQIIKVNKNNYYVNALIDSNIIPDHVICYDVWEGVMNERSFRHSNEFYIQPDLNKFINQHNNINAYDIKIVGLGENETISNGKTLNIHLLIRNFYDYYEDLVAKYRLYFNVGNQYEVDVIPLTNFNKNNGRFFINLDTSWLIPNRYVLEYMIMTEDGQELRKQTHFIIPSAGIKV